MSGSSPNLQYLPGDVRYRRCFRAPDGRVLVRADFSQVELRIAARISGDREMLDAYARGDDLHTKTARQMTGKADVTPAERKLAKPVNFGLIYGLSAKTLRRKALSEYGVSMTAPTTGPNGGSMVTHSTSGRSPRTAPRPADVLGG